MSTYRTEYDSLGAVQVPYDAYYGAQTQRAIENFPISHLRLPQSFIKAQAIIKAAAATVNHAAGRMPTKIMKAIVKASEEIIAEKLQNQFVVDVYQAGAGTSQNMNMNEVLANRALEIVGKKKGDYNTIHPNNDVNMGQSTNDTIHSAIHMAAYELNVTFMDEMKAFHKALLQKEKEFKAIYKSGRTHLQDAVPISLGQEFSGYAAMIEHNRKRIATAVEGLTELPIGGTALGTGINTHPSYQKDMIQEINRRTGFRFKKAHNIFEVMQNCDAVVNLSGALKTLSVGLTKLANDVRLLSSGPYDGLGELSLPAVQPGSSIMPGKVNPAMAEMLNMVAYQVVGYDETITEASQAAQLELNVMMPLIAYNILEAITILTNAIRAFRQKCVQGIQAHEAICLAYLEKNPIIATALTPYIGYEKIAKAVKRAYKENRTIKEIVLAEKWLSEKELNKILDYKKLTKPNVS